MTSPMMKTITAVIVDALKAQIESDPGLYVDYDADPKAMMVDGYVDVTVLAEMMRSAQEEAWERGMADAKLLAAGIRPVIRNPYLKEEES